MINENTMVDFSTIFVDSVAYIDVCLLFSSIHSVWIKRFKFINFHQNRVAQTLTQFQLKPLESLGHI